MWKGWGVECWERAKGELNLCLEGNVTSGELRFGENFKVNSVEGFMTSMQ
jgi:hypothetical protein